MTRCSRFRTAVALYVLMIAVFAGGALHAQSKPSQTFAALSARANAARDADRLDEAATLYKQAVALHPTWAEGWWSRIEVNHKRVYRLYREEGLAMRLRQRRRIRWKGGAISPAEAKPN